MTTLKTLIREAIEAAASFAQAIKAAGVKPLPNHEGWNSDIEDKYFAMLKAEKLQRLEFRTGGNAEKTAGDPWYARLGKRQQAREERRLAIG